MLLHPVALLVSQALNLLDHAPLGVARGMPVIGLQTSDSVHGLLALVSSFLDKAHKIVLGPALEILFDLIKV